MLLEFLLASGKPKHEDLMLGKFMGTSLAHTTFQDIPKSNMPLAHLASAITGKLPFRPGGSRVKVPAAGLRLAIVPYLHVLRLRRFK